MDDFHHQQTINFMISAEELSHQINNNTNMVIIDVREKEDYDNDHIPTAVNFSEFFTYLPSGLTSDKEKKDFIDYFQNLLGKAGVEKTEFVVFYEDKYTLMSPRGLLVMKYLGYDENKIKILDGGYIGWVTNKYKTTSKKYNNPEKSFNVELNTNFFVDYNQMLEFIDDESTIILDTRDKDEWLGISSSPYGIDFAPKKGRLPNAEWIEWYNFITEDHFHVNNLEHMQSILDEKSITRDDDLILYCFKGARIANNYIALRRLGYTKIRIYFAGWNEWCRVEGAPIINEVDNNDDPLLKENIMLKRKLDKAKIQNANMTDFPKFIKEPIFSFDREGAMLFKNLSTENNLTGINHLNHFFPDISQNGIHNIIDNSEERSTTILHKDKYYLINIKGSRLTNKVLGFGYNTTELHLINKDLEKKLKIKVDEQIRELRKQGKLIEEKRRAVRESKEKSEFLANMSHEIRTPLNAILGFIDLLKEKNQDKESKNYLNIINKSGVSLLNIINDILDFSKLGTNKIEITPIVCYPQKEISSIINLFKARSSEKTISLDLIIDGNLPLAMKADIFRIKQVLSNLLSNAIKFTEAHKKITVKIDHNDGLFNCSVEDEGIGISRKAQSEIFAPFSQAESSTTRKYGGTGLGLTISSRLVNLMGGELKVDSDLGNGSIFYFSIPAEKFEESGKIKDLVEEPSLKKIVLLKGNILLVEDNKVNQMLMRTLLKKQGLGFDIAEDGVKAVKAYKTGSYDLILMDENMPNLTGIDATKQIRQFEISNNKPTTPIIALTANALDGDRERFISAGMDEYLSKPVDKLKLNRIMKKHLKQ